MRGRRLARLLGLLALWQAINVLERVAYAAGIHDAATEAAATFSELKVKTRDVDEDQGDEPEPAPC